MKCPKCGSEYHIGGTDINGNLVCRACQLKELKDLGFLNDKDIPQTTSSNKIIIETEITTAEMLLWLWKCNDRLILQTHTNYIKNEEKVTKIIHGYSIFINGNISPFFSKTREEAIKQAYEWARKEEQNAKN